MKQLVFLFFFITCVAQAQYDVIGVVKDQKTNKTLPFATVTIPSGLNTIADAEGRFLIKSNSKIDNLKVSYLGYDTKIIDLQLKDEVIDVFLNENANDLNTLLTTNRVVAQNIISKVIKYKSKNNPQNKLKSFEFKAYNKLIVTANPDSIKGRIDTIFDKNIKKLVIRIDSSDYKFKKIVSKQHLFQTESISQFQYDGKLLKEEVLATKMAGFKQPIYEVLGFSLQSFSVYDKYYELIETKFSSPVANNALKKYKFKLLDSIKTDGRLTYLIHFESKKNRNGLQGLLYVDKYNFAIAKAIIQLKNVLNVTAIHEFKYVHPHKLWFPSAKFLKIVKGKNDDDIKILGGTIQFNADTENFKTRDKVASDFTYLLSETSFSNFLFNSPIHIKKSIVSIEVKEDATNKSEKFWNKYRKDTLDFRSQRTYSVLDSISIKNRIESRLRFGRKVIKGYIPLGKFDLDLRYLLSFNNYEGFRLGLGGVSSEKFSKIFRVEGYSAYGTKDGNFKYNLGLATRIGKFSNTWIGASYTDDVKEIASTTFAIDKRIFKIYDPRPINVSTFYNYLSWKAYIETKIIPKTESIWQISHNVITPKFDYVYNLNDKLYSTYTLSTAMVSMQWNPFSRFMQTPLGRLEIDKKFPKFTFQFTKSLPKFMDNDFNFGKIDIRTEYEKKYLDGQKTSLLLTLGYGFGDIPITHLYNTSPNNLTKDRLLQRITLAGKNSFETMYFNEFFSSEYISFQIKHGSKRVTLFKKVKPSLVLVSRMAWGNLKNPEQQVGVSYKTINKGYFESGIELNQIYKGLGLSGFYRYGPYQLLKFENNISLKLSFILDLGF